MMSLLRIPTSIPCLVRSGRQSTAVRSSDTVQRRAMAAHVARPVAGASRFLLSQQILQLGVRRDPCDALHALAATVHGHDEMPGAPGVRRPREAALVVRERVVELGELNR